MSVVIPGCSLCRDCYGCLILRVCDTKNKTTSAIWEQQSKANNEIDWERLKILDQETVDIITKSKEAIHIRHQYPILNRAGGYDLPGIFNHLLSRDLFMCCDKTERSLLNFIP